jgi:preprotein translocase subunit YajC
MQEATRGAAREHGFPGVTMSLIPFISDVYAQSGGAAPAGEAQFTPLLFIVVMFVIFYFLLIRPQAKRQKEIKSMIGALNKGDEIVTTGGLVGRISELSDQFISLQVASAGGQPVTVSIQRNAVATLLPKGTMKSI